jgi:hypothetical protein
MSPNHFNLVDLQSYVDLGLQDAAPGELQGLLQQLQSLPLVERAWKGRPERVIAP